jgi:hypothetical protein
MKLLCWLAVQKARHVARQGKAVCYRARPRLLRLECTCLFYYCWCLIRLLSTHSVSPKGASAGAAEGVSISHSRHQLSTPPSLTQCVRHEMCGRERPAATTHTQARGRARSAARSAARRPAGEGQASETSGSRHATGARLEHRPPTRRHVRAAACASPKRATLTRALRA